MTDGAENPTVRLRYTRGPGAADCPDEEALRDAVAARLGYDPFRSAAPDSLSVLLAREGRGLRTTVELRDPDGRLKGTRLLDSARHDCSEMASAMALAISIAIDPLAIGRSQPLALSPEPQCPRCPELPPPPPPARERVHPRLSLGVVGAAGSAPAPALGFELGVGLRYRAVSLTLEGRFDVPFAAPQSRVSGSLRSSLLVAMLAPCAHWRWLAGCALFAVGALHGEGLGVALPSRQITVYAAAGWRIAAELHLRSALWARIHLDGLATLTRTTLALSGVDTFTTPPMSGALGLELVWQLR